MATEKKGRIIFNSDNSIEFSNKAEATASLTSLPDGEYSGVFTFSSMSGSIMFDNISNKNLLEILEKYLEK